MIQIVCLKWGTLYSAEYVNILYAMLKRNLTIPFELICFTDDATDIDSNVKIKFLPENNLKGWWNKMYLFSEDTGLSGHVFYLDLDTMITGNIDDIVSFKDSKLKILSKGAMQETEEHRKQFDGDYGSGLMSWTHELARGIWEVFKMNQHAMNQLPGDQDFLKAIIPKSSIEFFQDIFPDQIYSYKYQCYENGLPETAKIVCFHGVPNPKEAITQTSDSWGTPIHPRKWVGDYWRL